MRCKPTRKTISRYLDDEISPSSRAALEGHLAQCPDCPAELVRQQRLWQLLGALEPIEPPEVFAAVEQQLAARQSWTFPLAVLRARAAHFAVAAALFALFVFAGVWAGFTWSQPAVRGHDRALSELLTHAPAGMEFVAVCEDSGGAP